MVTARRLFALLAAGALVLAACSSEGGAQSDDDGGNGGDSANDDAPAVEGENFTIALVTHSGEGDTFWDKVRAGAEEAAARHNIDLRYSRNDQAAEQATLVQNAVDSKVDGIAVTLAAPEAMQGAVKAAQDAEIPVVALNAGLEQWQDMGILMYFGSDETVAGEAVGERLTELGAGKALCVIHEQGSVALEARCKGVASTFPNTENINVDGTDVPSLKAKISAKLQEDSELTHIVSLNAPLALEMLDMIDEVGSDAQMVTFDLDAETAEAIKAGDVLYSVDQQPYVQGYLAVTSLWLNLTNGNDLGGGQAVLTGPSFVDETNIDEIAEYAANNTR